VAAVTSRTLRIARVLGTHPQAKAAFGRG
jgi:hypothetical protein